MNSPYIPSFLSDLEHRISDLEIRNNTQAQTINEFGHTPQRYKDIQTERDQWRQLAQELMKCNFEHQAWCDYGIYVSKPCNCGLSDTIAKFHALNNRKQ